MRDRPQNIGLVVGLIQGVPLSSRVLCRCGLCTAMLLAHGSALGDGFRTPFLGTFGLGRAGGKVAHVDDSSAVVHNPANLVELEKAEIAASPTFVYYGATFESPTSGNAETINPWKFLPNAFAAKPLKDGQYAVGLGITTPFGLATEWDETGTFLNPFGLRYQAPHFAQLKTINLNPTLAAKLTEGLSIGVGFDATWSEITLEQYYPWGPAGGVGEGIAKFKGDNWGFGGNLGVTWRVNERHRLALTYRTRTAIKYEGEFTISNFQPGLLPGTTPSSPFKTKITLPDTVTFAYGVRIKDTIRVEANVEWLSWSHFDSLSLDAGNNNLLLTGSPAPAMYNQDWSDTFTAGLGADWQVAPKWVVRAGYQFSQSPVPDYTLSPTIPDSDANILSVGVGFRSGHHSLEASYGVFLYASRSISSNQNPAFIGDYEQTVHLIGAQYRFIF